MPKHSKAQTAYEFLIIAFILTFSFTMWLTFSAHAQNNLIEQSRYEHITDLGLQIQQDLYETLQMPNGFQRTINIPVTIQNQDYDLLHIKETNQDLITIKTENYQESFTIPQTNGTLQKQDNILKINQGILTITQS